MQDIFSLDLEDNPLIYGSLDYNIAVEMWQHFLREIEPKYVNIHRYYSFEDFLKDFSEKVSVKKFDNLYECKYGGISERYGCPMLTTFGDTTNLKELDFLYMMRIDQPFVPQYPSQTDFVHYYIFGYTR